MRQLREVFAGWNGYQTSLVKAISPLTPAQLAWRPAPALRSLGQTALHIALGRAVWFSRMGAPGAADLWARIEKEGIDEDGELANRAEALVHWLGASWTMVEATLAAWTVDDLARSYRHEWNGSVYAVSRQWTIWRILIHDTHHGGQVSMMLAMQGIEAFELRAWGGHITLPPLADEKSGDAAPP